MTVDAFLVSLRSCTRAEAIEAIDGWLWACERWPDENPTAAADRPKLIAVKVALQAGRSPGVLFG